MKILTNMWLYDLKVIVSKRLELEHFYIKDKAEMFISKYLGLKKNV